MAKPTKSDRVTWGRVASTSRTDEAAIRSVPPKPTNSEPAPASKVIDLMAVLRNALAPYAGVPPKKGK